MALPGDRENEAIHEIIRFHEAYRHVAYSTIEAKFLSYCHYIHYRNYEVLAHEMKAMAGGSPVFDLGCGGGALGHFFKAGTYVGLEIELNRILTASLKRDHIFILGDVLRLPFKANAIKAFVSVGALEHTADFDRAIKEMGRVVSGNGYISVPARDTFTFVEDPVNYIRLKRNLPPVEFGVFGFGHLNMLDKDGWRDLIAAHDFEIKREGFEKRLRGAQLTALSLLILFHKKRFENLPVGFLSRATYRKIEIIYDLIRKFDIWIPEKNLVAEFYVQKK